jgi:hypothetical protein
LATPTLNWRLNLYPAVGRAETSECCELVCSVDEQLSRLHEVDGNRSRYIGDGVMCAADERST